MRVLVVGAGGYVGSRLVPLLLRGGQEVRATFTDPARARRHAWADAVEVVHVDVLDRATVRAVVSGVDAVVYLVHGLRAAGFTVTDRTAALHTADACAEAGVRRIVYLSGLVPPVPREQLSAHIDSRLEVEDLLTASGTPTTVLRAAMVIGRGSTPFELMRQVAERMPVQVVPTWMHARVQPVAVVDALAAVTGALGLPPEAGSRSYDVGGPDVVPYVDLLHRFAELSGTGGPQLRLPGLPGIVVRKLAAALVDVPSPTVEAIMESLRHDMVCAEDDFVRDLLPPGHRLLGSGEAMARALAAGDVAPEGDPMGLLASDPDWAG